METQKTYKKNDPEYFKSYYEKNKDKFKIYNAGQNSNYVPCQECDGKMVKIKYMTAHKLTKCHREGEKRMKQRENDAYRNIVDEIRREYCERGIKELITTMYDDVEVKPEVMVYIKSLKDI
jgi:hypothetical protein